MNSIDIRTEKANAIFRYQSFQKLTTLFRFIEILVFILVISTFSSQFPVSVDNLLRGFTFPCISPKLVFVIGNVIILILLFKSRFTDHNANQIESINVYDEYIKRCEKNVSIQSEKMNMKMKKAEVECRKGQGQSQSESQRKLTRSVTERKILNSAREICRSQSENMMIVRVESEGGESARKLRRSVTEKKMLKNGEKCGVDELSNEAFRRTVEAFIERQQRSLRDEELAPMQYVGK